MTAATTHIPAPGRMRRSFMRTGIALAVACPGTTLAQVGVGYRDALFTIAGGLFGGIMGGGGGGMIGPSIGMGVEGLGSPFAALGIAVGFIGVAYTVARTIFTRIVRKRREALQGITEKLAEQARRSLAPVLSSGRDARRLPR